MKPTKGKLVALSCVVVGVVVVLAAAGFAFSDLIAVEWNSFRLYSGRDLEEKRAAAEKLAQLGAVGVLLESFVSDASDKLQDGFNFTIERPGAELMYLNLRDTGFAAFAAIGDVDAVFEAWNARHGKEPPQPTQPK